jgi:DNA-binding response OmpR family regulator
MVKPPLWLSIYALFLYTIIILTLCYLAIRYYRKRSMEESARKDELWESKKQKELYNSKLEFFTHVTHEIRTPLTLIKGPLEEVLKNCGELPSLQGSLTTMSRNTDRLLELTDQLLDFKKTETKGFSLNFTNINITRLLEDNCLRYKLAMADRNLELNVDLPKRTIYGLVDPESLNKIFSNLIDNAVKYADSKIFITVQLHDHTFQLDIKSDGYLIPIKDQEKIFEPFYRLEMNRNQRGTGIGLSLARALAELHHGSLQLANVDQHYNLFSLIIPRCEPDMDLVTDYNHPDISEYESEQDPALKQAILLVDDNIEIREFSAARLRKNFKVLQAGNGMEAMDVIMQHSIQLIVSDVMMPVMDGYTLCQTIKNNLEYAHIPIIMLTAKSTLQSKIAGLESGADAYIEKPFSPEHLLTQINNLLSSREKIKNYFASSPLAHMKSMACNKPDEKFLDQLNKIILANISNKSLDVELLAGMMNMTRPTFYRKIKAISNLTPHELITITRLKMAAELLVSENHKMLKIASMTGFGSQAQFTRSFTKQFGMSPTEFSNMNKLK